MECEPTRCRRGCAHTFHLVEIRHTGTHATRLVGEPRGGEAKDMGDGFYRASRVRFWDSASRVGHRWRHCGVVRFLGSGSQLGAPDVRGLKEPSEPVQREEDSDGRRNSGDGLSERDLADSPGTREESPKMVRVRGNSCRGEMTTSVDVLAAH